MNPGPSGMHNNTNVVPGEGSTSSKKSRQAVKRKLQLAAERDYQRRKMSEWESPEIESTAAAPSGISALEKSANPKALLKPRAEDSRIPIKKVVVVPPYHPSFDTPVLEGPTVREKSPTRPSGTWPKFPKEPFGGEVREVDEDQPEKDRRALQPVKKTVNGSTVTEPCRFNSFSDKRKRAFTSRQPITFRRTFTDYDISNFEALGIRREELQQFEGETIEIESPYSQIANRSNKKTDHLYALGQLYAGCYKFRNNTTIKRYQRLPDSQ